MSPKDGGKNAQKEKALMDGDTSINGLWMNNNENTSLLHVQM